MPPLDLLDAAAAATTAAAVTVAAVVAAAGGGVADTSSTERQPGEEAPDTDDEPDAGAGKVLRYKSPCQQVCAASPAALSAPSLASVPAFASVRCRLPLCPAPLPPPPF